MRSLNSATRSSLLWWITAVAIATAGIARIVYLGRETTFFFDEWNFLLDRNRFSGTSLLEAHNGHLSTIPVAIYQSLLKIFGAGTYFPYRLLVAVLHGCVAIVVGLIVRHNTNPLTSLAAVTVVSFMGAGWQNWLWGFQIGMILSVLSGLLAIYVLGHGNTRRRQHFVIGLLSVSILSSGVGIPVLVGIAALAFIQRSWVVVKSLPIILGLYVIWNTAFGESQARLSNVSAAPSFVAESASAVFAGIGGWSLAIGGVLAGATTVIILRSAQTENRYRAQIVALGLIAGTGWLLSALSRAHLGEPGASRYVHVGVCWVIPLLGLLLPNDRRHLRQWSSVVPLVLAVAAVWGAWDIANSAGRDFRDRSMIVRAELTAIMQIRSEVDPNYRPDPGRAPQISYGRLKDFAAKYSLPLLSLESIRSLRQDALSEMDRVYLEASNVAVSSQEEPDTDNCSIVSPNYEARFSPGAQIWMQGVHSVEVRRMGEKSISLVPDSPGTPSVVAFGDDTNPRKWRAKFVSAGQVTLCVR